MLINRTVSCQMEHPIVCVYVKHESVSLHWLTIDDLTTIFQVNYTWSKTSMMIE